MMKCSLQLFILVCSTLISSYDYLRVYDGDNIASPLIAVLTGSDIAGGRYWSTGRDIYLNLVSDGSVTRPGFTIQFDAGSDLFKHIRTRRNTLQTNILRINNVTLYLCDEFDCAYLQPSNRTRFRFLLQLRQYLQQPYHHPDNAMVIL